MPSAGPVYSETFVRTALSGAAYTYYVPAAHRAVVRSITFTNSGSLAGTGYVSLAGIYVFVGAAPVGTGDFPPPYTSNLECRHVAYAGQAISVYITAAGLQLVVSGYLFSDTGEARPAYEEAVRRTLPTAELPEPLEEL